MGNIGATEILLILLVVLLVFGAKRIPEIARGLGKGIREFKDATNDIKREMTVADTPPPPQVGVGAQPRQPAYVAATPVAVGAAPAYAAPPADTPAAYAATPAPAAGQPDYATQPSMPPAEVPPSAGTPPPAPPPVDGAPPVS